jgi:hypothetical protein
VKLRKNFLIILSVSLLFLFSGCGLLFNGSSTISIDLGGVPLPPGGSYKPATVTGYAITVSVPGSEPVVKNYDPDTNAIRLVVPSGRNRKIELEVALDPANPTPVLSFIGTAFVDLAPSETKKISLRMMPGRTRLLFPSGNSVYQMTDDSLGTQSGSLSKGSFVDTTFWGATGALFTPWDIDLDSRGRIYIANNNSAAGCIVRVDTITNGIPPANQNQIVFPPGGTGYPITAIGVDKYNNRLYYYAANTAKNATIDRINLDDRLNPSHVPEEINLNNEQLFNGSIRFTCSGIDIDRDGFVYITCEYAIGTPVYFEVVKIDPEKPAGSRIIANYQVPNTYYLLDDIVVKDDNVFVTNKNGQTSNLILMLRRSDLALSTQSGSNASATPPSFGTFYGPERFICKTNKTLYVIDEGGSGRNYIIYFDNLSWSGWGLYDGAAGKYYFFDGV